MNGGSLLILTGGVGGAKLCLGMQRVLRPSSIRIVVNTGDDFEHLGLQICPDIDTTLYTLAGLANPQLGWGRLDETWSFMQALESIGGETWFRLGDKDLAVHVERTRRLGANESLSDITQDFAKRFGIGAKIFPMSDEPVRTLVKTRAGEIGFQDYFVRQRCEPAVTSLRFQNADSARVPQPVKLTLADPTLRAIVIAPSNPYLSIDPILALPGMRDALRAARVPIIAVTPIIGGKAVKGPTAKIMREIGIAPSALAVIEHYHGLIDGFVLDARDAQLAGRARVPIQTCDTLMESLEDRDRVARSVIDFVDKLNPETARKH